MLETILDSLLRVAPLVGTVGGLATAVIALSSDTRHRRRMSHLATARKDAPPESRVYLDALHRRAAAAYVAKAVARARFGWPLLPIASVSLMAVALSTFIGVRAIIPSVDAVPVPLGVQLVMWALGPGLTGLLVGTFTPDRIRRTAWCERVQVLIERNANVSVIDAARPTNTELGLPSGAGSGNGFVLGFLIGVVVEASAAGLALATVSDPSPVTQTTVVLGTCVAAALCIFPMLNLARWRAWDTVQKANEIWLQALPARDDSGMTL